MEPPIHSPAIKLHYSEKYYMDPCALQQFSVFLCPSQYNISQQDSAGHLLLLLLLRSVVPTALLIMKRKGFYLMGRPSVRRSDPAFRKRKKGFFENYSSSSPLKRTESISVWGGFYWIRAPVCPRPPSLHSHWRFSSSHIQDGTRLPV